MKKLCAAILIGLFAGFATAQHNHGSSGSQTHDEETRALPPAVSPASKLAERLDAADEKLQDLKESVGVTEARNKALDDYIAVLAQIREAIRKADVDDFGFHSGMLQAMNMIPDHKKALQVLIEMAPADVKPSFEDSLASLDQIEKQLLAMKLVKTETASSNQ